MAIDIVIQGDYKDRDIKRAQRDLELLKTQSGTVGTAFSKMSGFAAGMGAAVGAAALQAVQVGAQMAIQFGVDGVKAFLEDEAAAAKLAQTMSNLGMEGATAAVEANIDALQRQFGVADDLLRPSMEKLLRVFNDVDTASRMMSLALDVSAGTGATLEQTVQALSRAAGGNALALGRIAPELDKATLAAGDMDVITKQLAETHGGQAQRAAGTYQGQLARLGVGFSELQEAFGSGFLNSLDNATQGTNDFMAAMQELEPAMRTLGTTASKAAVGLAKFAAESASVIDSAIAMADEPSWDVLVTHLRNTFEATDQFKGVFKNIPGIGGFIDDIYRVVDSLLALNDAQGAGDFIGGIGGGTFGEVAATAGEARKVISPTVAAAIAAGKETAIYGGTLTQLGVKVESVARASGRAAEKIVVLTEKQRNLALTMAGSQVAFKQATDDLKAIKDAAEDYAASTTAAIQGTVSLSTAFGDALKASEEGSLAAGQTVAGATIANLKSQMEATAAFEASLKAIRASGGSMALIEQLRQTAAAHGAPAGVLLAGEVLTGGFVPELTALLTDFDVFATEAGASMANDFFGQGIADANALLNGLSKEVAAQAKQLDKLGKNIGAPIAAAISEEIAQAIRDGIADGRAVAARRRVEAMTAASFVPITAAPSKAVAAVAALTGGGMVNIAPMAAGGPVSGGRPFLVGERGPELFVPGSNGNIVPNNAMGGNTYSITVQAGVGDPRAIGQSIVEYVKKFEQANGPVFRAA